MTDIKVGDRVELTAEARLTFPRKANRRGRIIGESYDGRCWAVLFDGNKTRSSFHKSFLQSAGPDEREPGETT